MIECVIFDLDNTLVDSDLDFAAIRAEIGIDESILEYRSASGPEEQRRVDEILERHENKAAATCSLCDGAGEILDFLRVRRIKTALLTRNSRRSVDAVLARHAMQLDFIVSREDAAPKPSPDPVLLICRALGVAPARTMMIGDYLYDIQAGQAAGCMTLLVAGPNRHRFEAHPDYEVASLHEAKVVIDSLLREIGRI